MNLRSISLRRITVPALACGAILLALLWAHGTIPWIPVVSETIGLAAVLLATGLSGEPALRGMRWTLIERLGLAATISLASAALAGLGLHLAVLPVTPTNVLTILFGASVFLGIASLPYRKRPGRLPPSGIGGLEVAVGLSSVVLLGLVSAILLLRPVPNQPALEAALLDDAGALLALPMGVRPETEGHINLALRAPSGGLSKTSLSITGDGLRAWSAGDIVPTEAWSVVRVPLRSTRSGTVHAIIEITNDVSHLRLPIQIAIAP
jgi:hypothetical protein